MNLPLWRFFLPLGLQLLLILAVPSRDIYTSLFGQTVILRTLPVDPYDLMRGYSQTLRYEISQTRNLNSLPGWSALAKEIELLHRLKFYLVLEAPSSVTDNQKPPQPWTPVAVSRNKPVNLPSNQIAIQGNILSVKYRERITYGLETYYLPEDRRQKINNEISKLQQQRGEERPFVVEVKIDRGGNAIPISLWLGDRSYHF